MLLNFPFWGHINIDLCFTSPFKSQRINLSVLGMKIRVWKFVDLAHNAPSLPLFFDPLIGWSFSVCLGGQLEQWYAYGQWCIQAPPLIAHKGRSAKNMQKISAFAGYRDKSLHLARKYAWIFVLWQLFCAFRVSVILIQLHLLNDNDYFCLVGDPRLFYSWCVCSTVEIQIRSTNRSSSWPAHQS